MHRPQAIRPVSPPPIITTCLPVARMSARRIERIAVATFVLLRKKVHRVVNALQLAPGNLQIARNASAPPASRIASNSRCKSSTGTVVSYVRIGHKLHALGRHLLETAVDDALLHLEFRNAVTQQSANAIGLFVNRDPMSGAIQLLRRRQIPPDPNQRPRSSCPGDILGGSGRIQPSANPRSTMLFSICLIVTAGSLIPSTHAASHGAGQMRPGKFGEIIGRVQLPHRFLPASAIHQIIPVRNQIVDRTAGVAKRHAAIHTARSLRTQLVLGKVLSKSRTSRSPVRQPDGADRSSRGYSMKPVVLPMLHLLSSSTGTGSGCPGM